jgi:hypothetical protein
LDPSPFKKEELTMVDGRLHNPPFKQHSSRSDPFFPIALRSFSFLPFYAAGIEVLKTFARMVDNFSREGLQTSYKAHIQD